ncbi:MAG: DUF2065 domain-containing protein [Ahrensia sp.]|nr:DUF2065 domain-containing protein [Ahrensia sp.]
MWELVAIVGVFIAIEGALYAGAPGFAKRMAAEVVKMDEADLRKGGVIALVLGFTLVWFIKG